MTMWRVLITSLTIWRLSHLLFANGSHKGHSCILAARPENFLGNRLLDCVCWLSVWFSAQTAVWVVGGLAGVVLNWFALSILSRTLMPSLETHAQIGAKVPNGDFLCLTVETTMQANHG